MGGVLGRAGEHERVEALLSTYLDGRASDAERALVELHLAACADCTRNLATLRATVAAVRELPKVHLPHSFAVPRSLARQSQTGPRLYPLLRAATTIAAFLFVLTVAGDLFLRSSPIAPAPAALAPTSVVMQSETLESTQPVTAPAAALAPKSAPPAAPAPLATPLKFDLAAPGTATPGLAAAAKAVPQTPSEPPVEKPLTSEGMGGGMGAGAAPVPPQPASAVPELGSAPTPIATAPVASPSPTPTAVVRTPEPTAVARAPAPQPSANQREIVAPVIRPAANSLRVAEDVLTVLVLILGVTTWIIRRRSR